MLTLSVCLFVAGSHDSFAFYLNKHGHLGPAFNWWLRELEKIIHKYVGNAIYRWSVTQSQDFNEQLCLGIRYFDLRIALKPGTDDVYLLHGYYGDKLELCLDQIKDFLAHNTMEVVILDFNHIYDMDDFHNKQCMSMLLEKFGNVMCPFADITEVTLQNLRDKQQQLLIFYQADIAKENYMFWPGDYLPSPWPDTTDAKKLLNFLDKNYAAGRQQDRFYVTQGVLTPNFVYILEHIHGNIKTDLAEKVNPLLVKWLKTKLAGKAGINIVIADFVEKSHFAEEVVAMNGLLTYKKQKATCPALELCPAVL